MNKAERINDLREKINSIAYLGIEQFNKNDCAHEIIMDWIYDILDILETK